MAERSPPPPVAYGQRHKDVGPSHVRAEPGQQAVPAVAPSSTAALAFDADDILRELAERM